MLFLFIFVSLFFAHSSMAVSYDYYVDENYDGDEEGTKDKPFSKISKAIEVGGSGSKILIKKGDYSERVTIKKGMDIYGEDQDDVNLLGGVEMEDKSSLNKVTIKTSGTAIFIGSNAGAQINNCAIKKFGKIGIHASIGSKKIVVENSVIYGGSGKGMYIERGRNIELSGNSIYKNKEEGIDIRAKVKGLIKNNDIHNNGESGIEIILGGADVFISGNKIQENGASGIAFQFYDEAAKTGEIKLKGNTILKNKKYGIDCALPSGGDPAVSYWRDSVNLSQNTMEGNGISGFNDFCKIMDAIEEVAQIEEIGPISENNDILAKEEMENDTAILEKIESARKDQEALEAEIIQQIDAINSTGKIKFFLFGTDAQSFELIKQKIEANDKQLVEIINDLSQVKNEEMRLQIQNFIREKEEKSRDWKNFSREEEAKRGIWNRLPRMLKIIIGAYSYFFIGNVI